MERNLEKQSEIQPEFRRGGMVEIRFRVPLYVAEWFAYQASDVFKHRNIYIRDILIAIWRKATNGRT